MANLQDLFNEIQADNRISNPESFEEFQSKMEDPAYAERISKGLSQLGYDVNAYEGLKKKEESMVESAPLSQQESEQPSATTEPIQEVGTEPTESVVAEVPTEVQQTNVIEKPVFSAPAPVNTVSPFKKKKPQETKEELAAKEVPYDDSYNVSMGYFNPTTNKVEVLVEPKEEGSYPYTQVVNADDPWFESVKKNFPGMAMYGDEKEWKTASAQKMAKEENVVPPTSIGALPMTPVPISGKKATRLGRVIQKTFGWDDARLEQFYEDQEKRKANRTPMEVWSSDFVKYLKGSRDMAEIQQAKERVKQENLDNAIKTKQDYELSFSNGRLIGRNGTDDFNAILEEYNTNPDAAYAKFSDLRKDITLDYFDAEEKKLSGGSVMVGGLPEEYGGVVKELRSNLVGKDVDQIRYERSKYEKLIQDERNGVDLDRRDEEFLRTQEAKALGVYSNLIGADVTILTSTKEYEKASQSLTRTNYKLLQAQKRLQELGYDIAGKAIEEQGKVLTQQQIEAKKYANEMTALNDDYEKFTTPLTSRQEVINKRIEELQAKGDVSREEEAEYSALVEEFNAINEQINEKTLNYTSTWSKAQENYNKYYTEANALYETIKEQEKKISDPEVQALVKIINNAKDEQNFIINETGVDATAISDLITTSNKIDALGKLNQRSLQHEESSVNRFDDIRERNKMEMYLHMYGKVSESAPGSTITNAGLELTKGAVGTAYKMASGLLFSPVYIANLFAADDEYSTMDRVTESLADASSALDPFTTVRTDADMVDKILNATGGAAVQMFAMASGSGMLAEAGLGAVTAQTIATVASTFPINYQENINAGMNPMDARNLALLNTTTDVLLEGIYGDAEIYKAIKASRKNLIREGVALGKSVDEIATEFYKSLPKEVADKVKDFGIRAVAITEGALKNTVEEFSQAGVQNISNRAYNYINDGSVAETKFSGEDAILTAVPSLILGGAGNAAIDLSSTQSRDALSEQILYVAANQPSFLSEIESQASEFYNENKKQLEEISKVAKESQKLPGYAKLDANLKAHILSETIRKKNLESAMKNFGLEDPKTKEEIANIDTEIKQILSGEKTSITNEKTQEDAVQKPSATEVLPGQPKETGEAGSQRKGVEPVLEGEGTAQEGGKEEIIATPKEAKEQEAMQNDIDQVQQSTGTVINLNEDGTLTINAPQKGGQSKKDAAIENAKQELTSLGYNVESKVTQPTQQQTEVSEEEVSPLKDVESTAKALEESDLEALFEKTKNKKYFRGQQTEDLPEKDIFISPNELVGKMYTKGKGVLKKLALKASNLFDIDTKVTEDLNNKLIESYKTLGVPVPSDILNGSFIGKPYDQYLKENPEFRRALESMGFDGLLNNFTRLNLPSPKQEVIVFDKANVSEINSNLISEAYHAAKADGSNPELVEAVESLLNESKPQFQKNKETVEDSTEAIVNEMNKMGGVNIQVDVNEGLRDKGKINIKSFFNRIGIMLKPKEVKLSDFAGKPIMLTISDELTTGEIINPITGEKIDNLKGGLGFNYSEGNTGYAWAYTNEKTATDVLAVAKQIYAANPSLYPDGIVPVAVVKMGKAAMISNEAVVRQVIQNLKTSKIPNKNKKEAFRVLKEDIKKQIEGVQKRMNEAATQETETANSDATTLKGYNDILDLISKSKTFDEVIDKITDLNIGVRPLLIDRFTSGEPGLVPNDNALAIGKPVSKALMKGLPKTEYKRVHLGHLVNNITEPALKEVPDKHIMGFVGIDARAELPIKSDTHPNYPYVLKGKGLGMLSETVHIANALPAAYGNVVGKLIAAEKKGERVSQDIVVSRALPPALNNTIFRNKPINEIEENVSRLIGFLQLAFPNTQFFTDKESWNEIMNSEGVKKYLKKGDVVYGLTMDGKIYLNPNFSNFNTPIHETGHLWVDMIEESSPELFQKGLELVEGSKELTSAIKVYGDTVQARKEALAMLIGNRGETLTNAAQKSKFKEWLLALWKYVQSNFPSLRNMKPSEIENLTLEQFINGALKDILGATQLQKEKTPKKKNNKESVPQFQIDIEAQESPLYQRRTKEDVQFVSNEQVRKDVPKMGGQTQKTEAKNIKVEPGMLVGSRINIPVTRDLGYPVLTIHYTFDKGKPQKENPNASKGEAITQRGNITLSNVNFNVNQNERELIAKGRSKGVMAMAVGRVMDVEPNFDGIELSFNPAREHLFVDANGRAVKSAEEVTIMGFKAYARGKITYLEDFEDPRSPKYTAPSQTKFAKTKEELVNMADDVQTGNTTVEEVGVPEVAPEVVAEAITAFSDAIENGSTIEEATEEVAIVLENSAEEGPRKVTPPSEKTEPVSANKKEEKPKAEKKEKTEGPTLSDPETIVAFTIAGNAKSIMDVEGVSQADAVNKAVLEMSNGDQESADRYLAQPGVKETIEKRIKQMKAKTEKELEAGSNKITISERKLLLDRIKAEIKAALEGRKEGKEEGVEQGREQAQKTIDSLNKKLEEGKITKQELQDRIKELGYNIRWEAAEARLAGEIAGKREGRKEGRKEGVKEGVEKGKEQAQKTIDALNKKLEEGKITKQELQDRIKELGYTIRWEAGVARLAGEKTGKSMGRKFGEFIGYFRGLRAGRLEQKGLGAMVADYIKDVIDNEFGKKGAISPATLKAISRRAATISNQKQLDAFVSYLDKIIANRRLAEGINEIQRQQKKLLNKIGYQYTTQMKQFAKFDLYTADGDLAFDMNTLEQYLQALQDLNQKVPNIGKMMQLFDDMYDIDQQNMPAGIDIVEEFKKWQDAADKLFNNTSINSFEDYRQFKRDVNKFLRALNTLHESGVISDDIFRQEREKVINEDNKKATFADQFLDQINELKKELAKGIVDKGPNSLWDSIKDWLDNSPQNFTRNQKSLIEQLQRAKFENLMELSLDDLDLLNQVVVQVAENGFVDEKNMRTILDRAEIKGNKVGQQLVGQTGRIRSKYTGPDGFLKMSLDVLTKSAVFWESRLGMKEDGPFRKYVVDPVTKAINGWTEDTQRILKDYRDSVVKLKQKGQIKIKTTRLQNGEVVQTGKTRKVSKDAYRRVKIGVIGHILDNAWNAKQKKKNVSDWLGKQLKSAEQRNKMANESIDELDVVQDVYNDLIKEFPDGNGGLDHMAVLASFENPSEQYKVMSKDDVEYYNAARKALQESGEYINSANAIRNKQHELNPYYMPRQAIGTSKASLTSEDIDYNRNLGTAIRSSASYQRTLQVPAEALRYNVDRLVATNVTEGLRDYYLTDAKRYVNEVFSNARENASNEEEAVLNDLQELNNTRIPFTLSKPGSSIILPALFSYFFTTVLVGVKRTTVEFINNAIAYPLSNRSLKSLTLPFSSKETEQTNRLLSEFKSSVLFEEPEVKTIYKAKRGIDGYISTQNAFSKLMPYLMNISAKLRKGEWKTQFERAFENTTGEKFNYEKHFVREKAKYFEDMEQAASDADFNVRRIIKGGNKSEQRQFIQWVPFYKKGRMSADNMLAPFVGLFSGFIGHDVDNTMAGLGKVVSRTEVVDGLSQSFAALGRLSLYPTLMLLTKAIEKMSFGDDDEKEEGKEMINSLTTAEGWADLAKYTAEQLVSTFAGGKYAAGGRIMGSLMLSSAYTLLEDRREKRLIEETMRDLYFVDPIDFTRMNKEEGYYQIMSNLDPIVKMILDDVNTFFRDMMDKGKEKVTLYDIYEWTQKTQEGKQWAYAVGAFTTLTQFLSVSLTGVAIPLLDDANKYLESEINKKGEIPENFVYKTPSGNKIDMRELILNNDGKIDINVPGIDADARDRYSNLATEKWKELIGDGKGGNDPDRFDYYTYLSELAKYEASKELGYPYERWDRTRGEFVSEEPEEFYWGADRTTEKLEKAVLKGKHLSFSQDKREDNKIEDFLFRSLDENTTLKNEYYNSDDGGKLGVREYYKAKYLYNKYKLSSPPLESNYFKRENGKIKQVESVPEEEN